MPTTFRPYQPDQLLLLSPDVREWLPSGHLVHHVRDLVDALELSAFYAPYEGDGRPPASPVHRRGGARGRPERLDLRPALPCRDRQRLDQQALGPTSPQSA